MSKIIGLVALGLLSLACDSGVTVHPLRQVASSAFSSTSDSVSCNLEVDGQVYSPFNRTDSLCSAIWADSIGKFQFAAVDFLTSGEARSIYVAVENFRGSGKYQVDKSLGPARIFVNWGDSVTGSYYGVSGEFEIDEVDSTFDHEIKGHFTFIAVMPTHTVNDSLKIKGDFAAYWH